MSRIDKTQPYRVRRWDGTLARIAVHDHHDGVCDLPADAVLTATAPAVSSPIW